MNSDVPEPGETRSVPGSANGSSPPDADRTLPPGSRSSPAEGLELPCPFGDYELLEEIGRGGMGVVYKARQVALGRLVALKMILAGGHAGQTERARFRTEAEAVARLQHPNIVQIHEVGEHDGLAYFSLEYCPGGSLAQHLAGTPLPPREAARLIEALARAVQAAHAAGVIHRDLKPSNILLQIGDLRLETADFKSAISNLKSAIPKITDFGLAKRLDSEAGQTVSGAIVGTPSYMAPEQAGGKGHNVGPAADIYGLGALLYDCLTGRPPFRSATPLETVLQVLGEEPVPPSRLLPRLPRDLETICLKCLQKEPHKRYVTAEALADDLHRFLNDEPIQARPVGAVERAWKWAKRRPAAAALLVVSSLAAGALLIGGLVFNTHLQVALGQVAAKQEEATAANEEAQRQRATARGLSEQAANDRQDAQNALHQARALLAGNRIAVAEREWSMNNIDRAAELLETCPLEFRGWEWDYLRRLCDADRLTFHAGPSPAHAAALSPDGRRVAVAGLDDTAQVWEIATGKHVATFSGLKGQIGLVVFSPDGRRLAASTHSAEGLLGTSGQLAKVMDVFRGAPNELRVWDLDTGKEILKHPGATSSYNGLAFDPAGRRLAIARHDQVVICDLATGKPALTLPGDGRPVTCVAFSPGLGNILASISQGSSAPGRTGEVRIWDVSPPLQSGSRPEKNRVPDRAAAVRKPMLAWPAPADTCYSVAFSPVPEHLALGSAAGTVWLYEWHAGRALFALPGHGSGATCLSFRADGQRLATGSLDRTVRVWDVRKGHELTTLRGHRESVWGVVYSEDGKELTSVGLNALYGSRTAEVKVWDADGALEFDALAGHRTYMTAVAFSADGRLLATADFEGMIKLWDAATHRELRNLKSSGGAVLALAFSPDGRRLASAGTDAVVRLWDTANGKELYARKGHTGFLVGLAFSPDGKRLVSASGHPGGGRHQAIQWDVATGERLGNQYLADGGFLSAAYSPDGKTLALGLGSGAVVLIDQMGRQVVRSHHAKPVKALAFSPDGTRLATGSLDQTVKIWDVRSGEEIHTLGGHTAWVLSLAFSPDGRRLASASGDPFREARNGEVKLWDVATGREVLTLDGNGSVAFSPDGRQLAALGTVPAGPCAKLWQAGPSKARSLVTLLGNGGPLCGTAFLPDGQFVVSGADDGTVRLWDAAAVEQVHIYRGHSARISGVAVSPDGTRLASASLDRTVKLWDTQHGNLLRTFAGHSAAVYRVTFSPDGRRLVSSSADGTARVWGVDTGQVLGALKGHTGEVLGADFSPDGKLLATASRDQTVKLWDAETFRELRTLSGHQAHVLRVAFSPDSRRLVSASLDRTARVWDSATGKELHTLRGHADGLEVAAFSPDGQLLATAGYDATIKVWDAVRCRELFTLRGHDQCVLTVEFGPDSRQLVSCSYDGKVKIWDVTRR